MVIYIIVLQCLCFRTSYIPPNNREYYISYHWNLKGCSGIANDCNIINITCILNEQLFVLAKIFWLSSLTANSVWTHNGLYNMCGQTKDDGNDDDVISDCLCNKFNRFHYSLTQHTDGHPEWATISCQPKLCKVVKTNLCIHDSTVTM